MTELVLGDWLGDWVSPLGERVKWTVLSRVFSKGRKLFFLFFHVWDQRVWLAV